MEHVGITVNIKNKPELDPGFIPLFKFNESFLQRATVPFAFALERNDKQIIVQVVKNYVPSDIFA